MSKVLLILVDGMTPASLSASESPFFPELCHSSRFSLNARTVMPSVTLPCHMSLFLSVGTERHGILTNTYVPQVRPVNGLCEVLSAAGKKCAFFYNWEELRDLSRPGSLCRSEFVTGKYSFEEANRMLTDRVIEMLQAGDTPDFIFLYLGWVDAAGHKYGWMTPEYLVSVRESLACIERVIKVLPDDPPPLRPGSNEIAPGKLPDGATILDIAPTIAAWLGVPADPEWEGKILQ